MASTNHLGFHMVPVSDEGVPGLREGVGPVWVQLVDDEDGKPLLVLTHVAPTAVPPYTRDS